jgi:hypothetical protein
VKNSGIERASSILWRRLDRPGHESARLSFDGSSPTIAGTAVFAHDQRACRLDYEINCDVGWRTLSARVGGWMGERAIEIAISADASGRWRLNGIEQPQVSGCIDLDLNFSPSTNLLPIRRLELAAGQSAPVRAAWLRFPDFTLEPLDQVYTRLNETAWRYESRGGEFVAELQVNASGFVTSYPQFCREES